MTATDELRRLLDERGVEWMPSVWSARDETFYKVGNTGFLATEMSGGRMKVCIEGYVAPEQAVEATLGRGECHRQPHIDLTVGDDFLKQSGWDCSECGYRLDFPVNYCPNCGRKVVGA